MRDVWRKTARVLGLEEISLHIMECRIWEATCWRCSQTGKVTTMAELRRYQMFINGKWNEASDESKPELMNPTTEKIWALLSKHRDKRSPTGS